MREFRSTAAVCALLLGALPFVASAQANHNTARSNKNTVAAPAGETGPADGNAKAAQANHNTARSNKNTVAAPSGDTAPAGGSGEAAQAGK